MCIHSLGELLDVFIVIFHLMYCMAEIALNLVYMVVCTVSQHYSPFLELVESVCIFLLVKCLSLVTKLYKSRLFCFKFLVFLL